MSLHDDIEKYDATREQNIATNAPKNLAGQNKHKPSGHGKGKWQTMESLQAYRKKRNAKRKGR